MAAGRFTPLKIPPGIILVDSDEASEGRFVETQWTRFVRGLPEKVGGFTQVNTTLFTSTARGALAWNTNFGSKRYALGSADSFWVAEDGEDLTERMPAMTETEMPVDAFATTSGDDLVTVAHTAHGLSSGDIVRFRGLKHVAGGLIGDLDLDGDWEVTVTGVNSYTFVHPDTATATVATGGGRVLRVYPLKNCVSTIDTDNLVTIDWVAHGLAAGDYVDITNASVVGGITLAGIYQVQTVLTADAFKLDAGTDATSTVTAAGKLTIEQLVRPGVKDAPEPRGYGEGGYGTGPYGPYDPDAAGAYAEPRVWSINKWGEDLLLSYLGGPLFYYSQSRPGRPTLVVEAPRSIRWAFVTPERIVHALGVDLDPMRMAWCDQGDLTDWTADEDDQANESRRLAVGSRMMAGAAMSGGLNLIWTDTAVYAHQYTGGAFVFDTRLAEGGRGNGLLGPLAFVIAGKNGAAFWMSQSGFVMYAGYPQKIPNAEDVESWIFKRLDDYQKIKCVASYNALHNEVWFWFTLQGASEPNRYAMVQLDSWTWSYGELTRTSFAQFEGTDSRPLLMGDDGKVYLHEDGHDANGEPLPWALKYGPIGNGDTIVHLQSLDPDMQRQEGTVTYSFNAWDRKPTVSVDSAEVEAPDSDLIEPNVEGRWISMRLTGDGLGCDFRMGVPKVKLAPKGRRQG